MSTETVNNFVDRVVVITGGNVGVGRGAAVEFAKGGASLTLTGRNSANLEDTAKLCEQAGLSREKILLMSGDLTDDEFLKTLVKSTVNKFGRINVLVNNAAYTKVGTTQELQVADLDMMYKVNVRAPFILTQLAIPHLIQTKGSIINVSTVGASRPLMYVTGLSMTKASLNMFTKTLSLELAPHGVRVNSVNLGGIDSDTHLSGGLVASADELPEFHRILAAFHPMGRMGTVTEVAQTIVFLASDAASFITGTEIPVDGGRSNTSKEAN